MARPAGLVALLLAEVVTLTVWFDARSLVDHHTWVWNLTRVVRAGFDVSLVGGSVIALLAWKCLSGGTSRQVEHPPDRLGRASLILHLAAFAGFGWVTGRLFYRPDTVTPTAAVWTTLWWVIGLVSLLAWAACFATPRRWPALLARYRTILLVGALVGFVTWLAARQSERLAAPLAGTTFSLVRTFLSCFEREVISNPAARTIGTSRFLVEISDQCSGTEGIALILTLVGAFLWISRKTLRFPFSLLLLPVGAVLSFLANSIRIATLILVGTHLSPSLAAGAFHSRIGVVFFLAVGFGLIGILGRSACFARRDCRRLAGAGWGATEAYLCPMLVMATVTLATGALSEGPDPLYPISVLATGIALWQGRKWYSNLQWSVSPVAVAMGVVAYAVWILLAPPRNSTPEIPSPFGHSGPAFWLWVACRAFGSVALAPVAEELAFRGYLPRRLMAADFESVAPGHFTVASFVISSVLFGLAHEHLLAGIAVGMIYALALSRRGELCDAAVAHTTTNAMIVTCALVSGDWSSWL